MPDRANLTKIEFGTLSTEAERRHMNFSGAPRQTHGGTYGRTDEETDTVNSNKHSGFSNNISEKNLGFMVMWRKTALYTIEYIL